MTVMTIGLATTLGSAEPNADIVTGTASVVNGVIASTKYVPTLGVYATEAELGGWVWDRRKLESLYLDSTRHGEYVGLALGDIGEGWLSTWWQSGTVEGLNWLGTALHPTDRGLSWTPQFRTGQFAVHDQTRPLFSDLSISQIVDPAVVDGTGVVYADLPTNAVYGSLHIARYRRTATADVEMAVEYSAVEEFTGNLATLGGGRAATGTEGAFVPADFSLREYEFLVSETSNRVYLNQDSQLVVGDAETTAPGLVLRVATWEDKGCGNGNGRRCYLENFPVLAGSVEVVNIDGLGTITTHAESQLAFADPTAAVFEVDYDLGLVKMGGYQAPTVLLSAALGLADTEIFVLTDELDWAQWPDQGVVTIGTEEIQYFEKMATGLAQCVRGFNATTAAVHAAYDKVTHRRQGLSFSNSIFVKYTAVPRIEYEVTDYSVRSANKGSWLDTRPIVNARTHSIVQLVSTEPRVAAVELEVDRPLMGGNLYGPVQYGTDVARLTARAVDEYGNPVPGVPLTIALTSGAGQFGTGGSTAFGTSNSLGEIYGYYTAPYDVDSMDSEVSSTTWVGADTAMVVNNISPLVSASDVWVFQVLKHDPILGSVGEKVTVLDSGNVGRPTGMVGWMDIDALVDQDFIGGTLYVLQTDAVKQGYNILDVTRSADTNGLPVSRFWFDVVPTGALVDGQPAWALQRDAVKWDPARKRGQKVILYEWNPTAYQHPVTGATGAYGPVHPDTVVGSTLTFVGRNLPVPDANDDAEPLGAYLVVAPTVAVFEAYAEDPYSGRVVYSDQLRLQVVIPNWLAGVDTDGVLPVPHGWKFVTLSSNVGAGLDGANFITVNPLATSINQFTYLKDIP